LGLRMRSRIRQGRERTVARGEVAFTFRAFHIHAGRNLLRSVPQQTDA